jgi:formylglycine-generating enzyme required for sulfatase activity
VTISRFAGPARWALVGTLLSASGCQVVAGYEDFTDKKSASPSSPAPHRCDALPPSKVAPNGATLLLVKPETEDEDDDCLWVDRDETSVETYRDFLQEGAGSVDWARGALADHCDWKTGVSDPEAERDHPCTREIEGENSGFDATKPIRCVDWCDAVAFCDWSGLELCHYGHWSTLQEPVDRPKEWVYACASNGLAFGYGTEPERGRCNIGLEDGECVAKANQPCAPATPGTYEDCVSPSGARNMLGNVSEWVRLCTVGVEANDPEAPCSRAGGAFDDELSTDCLSGRYNLVARNSRLRTLGFRCCSRLSAEEAARVE